MKRELLRQWWMRMGALVAFVVVLFAGAVAHADIDDEMATIAGGPRIFSIQPRPHRLGHEFQLGAGVLPMDAFYIGVVPSASYTYHFTDFWAWEIAGAGYSLNFDTSLEDDLYEDYGVRPVNHGGERIHLIGTTSLVVKPLFGKLAIFNDDIIASETFFVFGVGATLLGKYPRPTADVGMGLRFWSTDTVSIRFDLRDYLIFNRLVPKQALFAMLSVAFNFINDPSQVKVEAQK